MGLETIIKPCQCCGNSKFCEVISFKNIPTSGIYRSKIDAVQSLNDLFFDACMDCGLLRRRDF